MKLHKLTSFLEALAPLSYQESYDNSGLIVGSPDMDISGALVALDCTEKVLDEAIRLGYNLVISHHPIVFKGLKRFNERHYVERIVAKAIRENIALYAIHTNFDNVLHGVNGMICAKLGLQKPEILAPKEGMLEQLSVFVPLQHAEALKNALFAAGAGAISRYTECSFSVEGVGTFKPNAGATPYTGVEGKRHQEPESRVEVIFPKERRKAVLMAMFEIHPYEEVAYNIYALNNAYQEVGSGMIGQLETPMPARAFLSYLKENLKVEVIRHTELPEKPIERVAVCGGAGSFLLPQAIGSGADIFVTADFKYHEFFEADGKILVADIGHFESEQFTQDLLLGKIQKKFPNFAIRLTEENTNPIKYYF